MAQFPMAFTQLVRHVFAFTSHLYPSQLAMSVAQCPSLHCSPERGGQAGDRLLHALLNRILLRSPRIELIRDRRERRLPTGAPAPRGRSRSPRAWHLPGVELPSERPHPPDSMTSFSTHRPLVPAAPRDGDIVDGKYRIEQKLGTGGMG